MAHVLIVESDAWLSDSYNSILTSADYSVQCAASCEEALECMNQEIPDVIFLNETLRGAGSIELIHELRSYPDLVDIPIILCTQLDHDQLEPFRAALKAYGIIDTLMKVDLKPVSLLKAVEHATAKN